MTRDRDSKRQVRARMRATGERYTVARQAFAADAPSPQAGPRSQGGNVSQTITEQVNHQLNQDGFVVIRQVLAATDVVRYAEVLNASADAGFERWSRVNAARRAGDPLAEDDGTVYTGGVSELFESNDIRFGDLVDHPVAVGVADVALPAPHIPGGGGIGIKGPGYGHQGLHDDLVGDAGPLGSWRQIVLTWAITPFNGETGRIRAVPGSHRMDTPWPDDDDPVGGIRRHPDEVLIEADAGDLVVMSSNLWKANSFNASGERRLAIWVAYRVESLLPDDPQYRWNADRIA